MEIRKTTYHSPIQDTLQYETDERYLTDIDRHNDHVNFIVQGIAAVVAFINALLFLRVVFSLFAVESNSFTASLYAITDFFVRPFQALFSSAPLNQAQGSVLDIPAIVAMIVVVVLGWALSLIVGTSYRKFGENF